MDGSLVPLLLAVLLLCALCYGVYKAVVGLVGGRGKVSGQGSYVCVNCGSRGEPATRTKGSTGLELVLWLCFIVPGLIYSIWRVTSREKVCPVCKAGGMIPADSPRGRQLLDSGQGSVSARVKG